MREILERASLATRIRVVYFFALVAMAHVILPIWNRGQDWGPFGTWTMYSTPLPGTPWDLTWDNGQTYLFRDLRKPAQEAGLRMYIVYLQAQRGDFDNMQRLYGESLKRFCKCAHIEARRFQGTLFEHFLQKRELPILESRQL